MTRYAVSVGDRDYHVEVRDAALWVDGEPVACELTSLNGNGLHLLRQGTRSTEIYFQMIGDDDYEVLVDSQRLVARVHNPQRRSRRTEMQAAPGAVCAPMPGLVIDVLVEVGQEVEQGEVLLIQESMKMQMQIRSPIMGRISALQVKPGDQVEKGTLLARIVGDNGDVNNKGDGR